VRRGGGLEDQVDFTRSPGFTSHGVTTFKVHSPAEVLLKR